MAEELVTYQRLLDAEDAMELLSDYLHKYDEALPMAEQRYQEAYAEAFLRLKEEHGSTAAAQMVRGQPDVSALRRERDELRCRRQTANKEMSRLIGVHLRLRDEVRGDYARPSNNS